MRFSALVILLCVFFFHFNSNAQLIVCLDGENGQPVPFVLAYNLDSTISAVGDSSGRIDLVSFAFNDEITFSHTSYQTNYLNKQDLQEKGFIIYLTPRRFVFPPVKVSAIGYEDDLQKLSETITLLDSKEISLSAAGTPAEVLAQSGKFAVQKSQGGAGSPIIRSFEANKILLMVDGVRLNNAIYRGGHLQNSITIDENVLDKIEIIQGPGTARYGSDAIGGVIHFYTKEPKTLGEGANSFSGSANANLSSPSIERIGHLDFQLAFEGWASLTSVTYSDFGDIVQGRIRSDEIGDLGRREFYVERIIGIDSVVLNPDPEIQVGSAYSQTDLLQKFRFLDSREGEHTINLQYSISSDIPRYDRLSLYDTTGPQFAEWYYGPQGRTLYSYVYSKRLRKGLFNKLNLTLSHQDLSESRVTRRFRSSNRNYREEKVGVSGLNLSLNRIREQSKLLAGLEFYRDRVRSEAFSEELESLSRSKLDTRYPDGGSTMLRYGAYVSGRKELNPAIDLHAGLRFSGQVLNAKVTQGNSFPLAGEDFSNSNAAFTASIGLNAFLSDESTLKFRLSNGFRAPNLDDLSKVFESIPGSIVIPNENLGPEYVYNAEISYVGDFSTIRIELNPYFNLLQDLIVRQRGTHLGQDSVLYEDVKLAVLKNQNLGSAIALGVQGGIRINFSKELSLRGNASYNYGQITSEDIPLDHVPPFFGSVSLRYSSDRTSLEIYSVFNGAKVAERYNVTGSDKFEFATSNGLPSWITLNGLVSHNILKGLNFDLRLENIFDINYRTFGSGISAPGRNISLGLRMNI